MLLFDIDQHIKSSSNKKSVSPSTSTSCTYIINFYVNTEIDDEDYFDQHASLKASSHVTKIDFYLKHGTDKMITGTNSGQHEEYNPLLF
ncbi:unnamed protein product [Rotaria sordida]|uniref:Uncharacterized protein n=1 Tax=Rotaria sordida TaxID=392033 RepID=A0A815CNG7_9BILA|nr:unnamed protein product [Rotaria sordida]CAF1377344.1 unnamed protein product [Rotaria sordida]CAF3983876.1 unnamed protein product [Rotaria sordida]CAF3997961.1 unnamed protein product [Rotaria sordida]